jgi:hypothetical protein
VRGYKRVDLFDGEKHCGQLVHRLVLSAFGGPLPNGKEAHHRDGNKGNNSIENLEYVTRSQNQIKSLESGRPVARGVHNGRARLSENDVREIRGLCANGASDTHIAQRYKIGRSTVWCIRNAETWRHVPLEATVVVSVERLREIDIALRHGHECAQEDLQPTIDYVGSLLREEKT